MPPRQMPVLVKHCALAIYKSGYCSGVGPKKVQQALDIAVSRLVQYGFLWKNAGKVAPEKINLTAKGLKSEAFHRREFNAKAKTDEWNALYKLIQEEVEEDDGAGATSEEAEPVAQEGRGARKAQRRMRLAKAARSSAKRRPKPVKRPRRARRR